MRVKSKKFVGYHWLLLLLVFAPLAGCYAYVDAETESLSPGVNVRIRLDEESFGRVVNQAASDGYDAQRLDYRRRGLLGRVVESTPDSLSIVMRGAGSSAYTARVPNWAISEAAVRELDLKKSVLVAGAGFAAFSAAFIGGWIGGTTSMQATQNVPITDLFGPTPIISIPFP